MNILENYGYDFSSFKCEENFSPARVTAVHRGLFELVCEFGEIKAKLKTVIYYKSQTQEIPTVGDFVLVEHQKNGVSTIVETLPRFSVFSRRDPNPNIVKEQAVAANFNYCFILTSLNLDFNLARLERYVSIAWQSGANPVVLLTKSDLVENFERQLFEAQKIAIGADVFAVSVVNGQGIEQLKKYLQPQKTAVFLGSSGVGKSSLLNALSGEKLMLTKEIRTGDSRGRHTTTHRQLFLLNNGAMVIDTPGMRGLKIWNGDSIGDVFSEVEEILKRGCKFSDCTHKTEPHCAIKTALENGELSPKRWQNYQKLIKEAKFVEQRTNIAEMKQKSKSNKKNYLKKKNDTREADI